MLSGLTLTSVRIASRYEVSPEEKQGKPSKLMRNRARELTIVQCDGRRPVCGRCEKNGADCIYDVAQEGITRMQNLQQLLEKKNEDHNRLLTLFNEFQFGSDDTVSQLADRTVVLNVDHRVEST